MSFNIFFGSSNDSLLENNISGNVTVSAVPLSILNYNRNSSILGYINVLQSINATSIYSSGYSISGSVQVSGAINATLDYTGNNNIIGNISVNKSVESSTIYNTSLSIFGSVQVISFANSSVSYIPYGSFVEIIKFTLYSNLSVDKTLNVDKMSGKMLYLTRKTEFSKEL